MAATVVCILTACVLSYLVGRWQGTVAAIDWLNAHDDPHLATVLKNLSHNGTGINR